jgi:hypothetical protein
MQTAMAKFWRLIRDFIINPIQQRSSSNSNVGKRQTQSVRSRYSAQSSREFGHPRPKADQNRSRQMPY